MKPLNNVNEPDLSPSQDLSYIVGVLKGDGCVTSSKKKETSRGYTIKLAVKSKQFCKEFNRALREVNLEASFFFEKTQNLWYSSVSSMKMYNWYKSQDSKVRKVVSYLISKRNV